MEMSSVSNRNVAAVSAVDETWPAQGTQPARVSHGEDQQLLFALTEEGEREAAWTAGGSEGSEQRGKDKWPEPSTPSGTGQPAELQLGQRTDAVQGCSTGRPPRWSLCHGSSAV